MRPALRRSLALALALPLAPAAAADEGERLYFAGALDAARPHLERRVEERPGDALAAYRLHYVLRALGAEPERQEAARAEARSRLEARVAQRPDPVGLYYLEALLDDETDDATRAAIRALLDARLTRPDPAWDAFALSRFLHLAREDGRDADALGGLLVRILDRGAAAWGAPPVLHDVAREVAAACAGRPERLARVERAFGAAIAGAPDRAALSLARARYLVDLGRREEAGEAVAAARAAGLDVPADRTHAAELLLELGDAGGAREVALELVGAQPSTRAWRTLARAERDLGMDREALVSWRRVLALDRTDVGARIGAADALESLGRSGEAEREYRAALAVGAGRSPAGRAWLRLSWAHFLERQERLEEALAAVADDALAAGGADARPAVGVYRLRVRTCWRLGRHERALEESARGLAAHPGDAGLLHWRSLAFRDRGEDGDARRALEANAEACAADPDLRAYRAVRVELLWNAGRDDDAVALQRELLDERASDRDGWLMLGRMLSARPDGLADAAQVYRRALAHFPEDPTIWRRLMETLAILRQEEQRLRS